MSLLYANGCSMVFGKDLVPMTMEQEDNEQKYIDLHKGRLEQAWPNVLAERLNNCIAFNAGVCGASMSSIVRRTVRDLAQLRDIKPIIAIIGLTEPQRFEYYEDGKWRQVVLPRDSIKYLRRDVRKFAENVAWYQHQWKPSLEQYLVQIILLQSHLKALGIPYVMVHSLEDYLDEALSLFPSLERELDMSYVMSGAMYTECLNKGFEFGSTVHPLQRGHRYWAGRIYDFISEKHPGFHQAVMGEAQPSPLAP